MNHRTSQRELPVLIRAGAYSLQRQIGRGAASVVYQGQSDVTGGDVAIKVFLADWVEGNDAAETFAAEVSLLRNIDHPAIVQAFEAGETDEGFPFIAYELVNGEPLGNLLARTTIPLRRACRLILTLAEALEHVHQQLVTHRDIKPENIMVRDGIPVLIDFSLALTDDSFGDQKTAGAGTPSYTSPEQAAGMGHLADGRSDLFSLGAVFYEMLTGTRPFQGNSREECLQRVLHYNPRSTRCFNDQIPAEVDRICLKCLSKQQEARYATASDLADDLRAFLEAANEETTLASIAAPCGLRAFGHQESGSFGQLLPGPIVGGHPESIHFWKEWIEHPTSESGTGVLYGCSGAGKTSLIRAGILPSLSQSTVVIYLSLADKGGEKRLRSELYRQCPYLPHGLSPQECINEINTGRVLAGGRRLLIVLDQFEHWLQRHGSQAVDHSIARMLQEFNCPHARCIVAVRHDFWLELSRLFLDLKLLLSTGVNTRLVDTFDKTHARSVLETFGRALRKFPQTGKLSGTQRKFLNQAVVELHDADDRVRPATLVLLVEVLRNVEWKSGALKGAGGIDGIGEKFLDQVTAKFLADARFATLEGSFRVLLEQLLPPPGSQSPLKRSGQSIERLATACKLDISLLEELLHFLDREERLVAPAEGKKAHWQLSHDVLVTPIRHWLQRDREKTWRGRVALRKESLAKVWQASDKESDWIPSWPTWVQYLCVPNRTTIERDLMRAAHRRQLPVTIAVLVLIGAMFWGALRWQQENRAEVSSHRLAIATTPLQLESALSDFQRSRGHAREEMERLLAEQGDSLGKFLAVASTNSQKQGETSLRKILSFTTAENALVVGDYLTPNTVAARALAEDSEEPRMLRLLASALLARADWEPLNLWWESKGGAIVSELLLQGNPIEASSWASLFSPRCKWLIPELEANYRSPPDANIGLTATVLLHQWTDHYSISDLIAFASEPYQFRYLSNSLQPGVLARIEGIAELDALEAESGHSVAARMILMRAALGDYAPLWHVLEFGSPELRSAVIFFGWKVNGLSPQPLVAKLAETNVAPLICHGCLLALGEYPAISDEAMQIVRRLASTSTNAATLLAARWLVDHFEHPLPAPIAETAERSDANWFLTAHRQFMIKIDAPERAFAIGACEVTEAEFARFAAPDRKQNKDLGSSNLPVTNITRNQARAYCNQLSLLEGLTPCYIADKEKWILAPDWEKRPGYRLATEDEWEIACKANTNTLRSFGDDEAWIPRFVWYNANSRSEETGTREKQLVGKLRPNPWGFFDMIGNVREMCEHPEKKNAVRGSTYNVASHTNIRSDKEHPSFEMLHHATLGFRLARSLSIR